jgi:hypothetical protein
MLLYIKLIVRISNRSLIASITDGCQVFLWLSYGDIVLGGLSHDFSPSNCLINRHLKLNFGNGFAHPGPSTVQFVVRVIVGEALTRSKGAATQDFGLPVRHVVNCQVMLSMLQCSGRCSFFSFSVNLEYPGPNRRLLFQSHCLLALGAHRARRRFTKRSAGVPRVVLSRLLADRRNEAASPSSSKQCGGTGCDPVH